MSYSLEPKACLFNLILYAQEERRISYLREIANNILEKFPCRIIFIKGDKSPDSDKMEITSSNEVVLKNNRKISCDVMQIDVGSKKLSQVPFLIIPNLTADLPIYLLWGVDPTSDTKILPYLEKYATKLIFDSECTSELQRFAREMLVLMDGASAELSDVNWSYISGWRDILAKVFDSEEAIRKLRNSKSIEIIYNNKKGDFQRNNEIQAIYFQAWLASRLGWRFATMHRSNSTRHVTYMGPDHEISINLIPQEEEWLSPGALLRIIVDANGHDYIFDRKQQQPKVMVHKTTEDRCELPITLSLPDLARRSVFMREVFYQSVNEHYRQMLEAISPVKWETK